MKVCQPLYRILNEDEKRHRDHTGYNLQPTVIADSCGLCGLRVFAEMQHQKERKE